MADVRTIPYREGDKLTPRRRATHRGPLGTASAHGRHL